MEDRFNPMTGEPLQAGEPEQQSGTNQQSNAAGAQPQITGYDPMTGQPIYGQSKRKKKLTWIPVVAAVLVVALLVFAGIKSGLFLTKSNKILMAMSNTLGEQSHLTKDLSNLKILADDSYTVSVEAEADGVSIEAQYVTDDSDKQISALWIHLTFRRLNFRQL